MILMLIRHAEQENDKLTKLGKLQCKLALKDGEKVKFSKIYCSPANRCVETAKFFEKAYKIPVEICPELKERELLKNANPQTKTEKDWYKNYLNPEFSSKNPEGCYEYLKRSFSLFDKLVKVHKPKNENVIIVAHSGTLYALSAFVHGIDKAKDITWMRMGACNKVYFEK